MVTTAVEIAGPRENHSAQASYALHSAASGAVMVFTPRLLRHKPLKTLKSYTP